MRVKIADTAGLILLILNYFFVVVNSYAIINNYIGSKFVIMVALNSIVATSLIPTSFSLSANTNKTTGDKK